MQHCWKYRLLFVSCCASTPSRLKSFKIITLISHAWKHKETSQKQQCTDAKASGNSSWWYWLNSLFSFRWHSLTLLKDTTIQQEVAKSPQRWIMLTNLSSDCRDEQSHKFVVVQSRLQTKQPNQTTLVLLSFRFKKSCLVLLKAFRNGRRNWALVPSPHLASCVW